jgi:hypothetical protein
MAYKPWRIFSIDAMFFSLAFPCQQHHRPSNSETLGKRLRPLAWPKQMHEIIVSSLPEGQDEYSDALQTQWRASSSSILPQLFLHKAVNNRSENLTPQRATHLAKGPPPTYRSSTETKNPPTLRRSSKPLLSHQSATTSMAKTSPKKALNNKWLNLWTSSRLLQYHWQSQ